MSGVELVERASFVATRAVRVETLPENVWLWIVQTAGPVGTATTGSITAAYPAPIGSRPNVSTSK